jgi:L-alanine-DL-glutamate epimerase-like enolase superfamily enzyme
VRKAVGPDITLMADANQRWDLATAQRILPALAEAELDWIEEPVHADDLSSHRRLQSVGTVDVAAGESVYSYHAFASLMAADAIRVVQPDVTRLAGVTEWLQVAHQAAGYGLRLVPHAGDMMQVHQHLAGVVLSEVPALLEFIPWTQEAFEQRSVVSEGFAERPQEPGASTAIAKQAREKWQLKGVGGRAANE